MKRFWDQACVVQEAGRFAIRLDQRPMRLPGGPTLALQSRALADAIAAEWQVAGTATGGVFQAEDVPLTRIAGTAQARITPDPQPTIDALARYGESDLLCYRADAPAALATRQSLLWQPWLDWVRTAHGADLTVTQGVMPVPQPPAALAALRRALVTRTPFTLAGLGVLIPATGSLVLGLAVADGELDAGHACELMFLDETFQAEHWGEDAEAAARRAALTRDIHVAARFITLSTL